MNFKICISILVSFLFTAIAANPEKSSPGYDVIDRAIKGDSSSFNSVLSKAKNDNIEAIQEVIDNYIPILNGKIFFVSNKEAGIARNILKKMADEFKVSIQNEKLIHIAFYPYTSYAMCSYARFCNANSNDFKKYMGTAALLGNFEALKEVFQDTSGAFVAIMEGIHKSILDNDYVLYFSNFDPNLTQNVDVNRYIAKWWSYFNICFISVLEKSILPGYAVQLTRHRN